MKKSAVTSMLFLVLFGWTLTGAYAATTTFLSSPPTSVVEGNLESNDTIFWFFERQTVLQDELFVDIDSAGTYPVPNSPGNFTISKDTPVRSYFIHFDPVGTPSEIVNIGGSFTFPYPILGIIVSDARLSATDGILGAPSTTYPTNSAFRGLEFGTGSAVDILYFNGDRDITEISFTSLTGVDQVRVITAVPVPGTVLLLGCGIIGLVGFRRKFQR